MGYNDSFSKANSIESLIEKLNKSLESGNFEKTEIPLIYQIKGKIMLGVYCFYEEAKDYIIGASIDCLVICKDQALCTYDEVERIFEDDAVYKPVEKLPLFKHLQFLDKNKTKLKAFNKTMELLKKHGVAQILLICEVSIGQVKKAIVMTVLPIALKIIRSLYTKRPAQTDVLPALCGGRMLK